MGGGGSAPGPSIHVHFTIGGDGRLEGGSSCPTDSALGFGPALPFVSFPQLLLLWLSAITLLSVAALSKPSLFSTGGALWVPVAPGDPGETLTGG